MANDNTDDKKVAEQDSASESDHSRDDESKQQVEIEQTLDSSPPEADQNDSMEKPAKSETPQVAEEAEQKTEAIESVVKPEPDAVEAEPDQVDSIPVETESEDTKVAVETAEEEPESTDDPNAKWYVVHTYSGHENKVLANLKQKIESEHLEHKILDMLVPTQDKIEIRSGKKEQIKEKIFPGYILVKMILDDTAWLAVRTTPGVTSFVGIGNKPTPIPASEVKSIVQFMNQGAAPTFKDVYLVDDTVKIIDGPFAEFIGKIDSVDKERGKVRVLVSIFGRETPVELDFLQVQKL